MGDRANIVVKTGAEKVHLYTHWSGSELPQILKNALQRGESRWDDDQYLTRIIFCEMIKDDVLGETGFGISQEVDDGEDRILEVNVDTQTIKVNNGTPMGFQVFIDSDLGW